MPKGIMRKIFLTTTLLMLSFFLFALIFQNYFLGSVYRNASVNAVKESFYQYIQAVEDVYDPSVKRSIDASSFTQNTSLPILVMSDSYEVLNRDFFDPFTIITINLGVGKRSFLVIDPSSYPHLSYYALTQGSRMHISGLTFGNSEYILPMQFTIKNESYTDNASISRWKHLPNFSSSLTSHDGYLNRIANFWPSKTNLYTESNYLLQTVLEQYYTDTAMNTYTGKRREEYYVDSRSAKDYVILAKHISVGGESLYFFTAKIVDNASVAFHLLNKYYIFFYVTFLLVMMIACFFYTKWVTGPLVYLNGAARKIAKLDFSDELALNTGDEIQELAESLSSVSKNLEQTIGDLRQSNDRLAEEAQRRYNGEKRIRYMLTNLSHEFKTPLGLIAGAKTIIEDGLCEKEPAYYFNTIGEQVDKLNQMIDEVIALSQLESGYFQMTVSDFDIEVLLKKVVALFHSQMIHKSLVLEIDPTYVTVRGDAKKIEQVLFNLVSNAIKYSPDYGVIVVRTTPCAGRLTVSIINDGNLPDDELTMVWSRFYRSEQSDQALSSGTGLGLDISARILELHESTYGAKRQDHQVIFYFDLPISAGR